MSGVALDERRRSQRRRSLGDACGALWHRRGARRCTTEAPGDAPQRRSLRLDRRWPMRDARSKGRSGDASKGRLRAAAGASARVDFPARRRPCPLWACARAAVAPRRRAPDAMSGGGVSRAVARLAGPACGHKRFGALVRRARARLQNRAGPLERPGPEVERRMRAAKTWGFHGQFVSINQAALGAAAARAKWSRIFSCRYL